VRASALRGRRSRPAAHAVLTAPRCRRDRSAAHGDGRFDRRAAPADTGGMRPILACLAVAAACGPEAATEVDAPPADAAADARPDRRGADRQPRRAAAARRQRHHHRRQRLQLRLRRRRRDRRPTSRARARSDRRPDLQLPDRRGPRELRRARRRRRPTPRTSISCRGTTFAVTQGVLGQFKRGAGVAALHRRRRLGGVRDRHQSVRPAAVGPTQAEVNAQIAICNAGSGRCRGTTSKRLGQHGSGRSPPARSVRPGGRRGQRRRRRRTFPPTCVNQPRWAALTPPPTGCGTNPGGVADPFRSTGTNTFRAYLIFRLPAIEIPIG
jgi:hypothetical protein